MCVLCTGVPVCTGVHVCAVYCVLVYLVLGERACVVYLQMKYRDRAKERRDRYGAIDPIIPSWKQQYDKEKLKKKKKNEEEE